jgi:hypothetical protein
MSNTIQTAPNPPAAPPDAAAPAESQAPPDVKKARSVGWYVLEGIHALASLRLTVFLFALSLLLVFFGTLAQIDNGIWTVVNGYFRWFYVWVKLQLLVQFGQVFFGLPKTMTVPGSFPFPGGLTLGILLLANLLAAHAVRFKMSWKRSGIFLIHGGLILMLLGEFIAYTAQEGRMSIEEGETANYVTDLRHYEMAVVSPDSNEKNRDHVTVIPARLLRSDGAAIKSDELPFDVKVVKWLVNARLHAPREGEENPATRGEGLQRMAADVGEVSGVDTKQSVELPACYVQLTKKDGTDLGTWLLATLQLPDQAVTVDGKTYDLSLRLKRTYKPYSLELLEFRYDRYPGTQTPKNFSSKVRLRDEDNGEDREVLIRMNEPLRYRGETFYQSGWNEETERGTVLQVVRNPGWLLPYFSCGIVALGMIVHFGLNLATFLQRRAA